MASNNTHLFNISDDEFKNIVNNLIEMSNQNRSGEAQQIIQKILDNPENTKEILNKELTFQDEDKKSK